MKWHQKCLPKGLWNVAKAITPLIKEQGAVLAGGTGLALRLGHRASIDLDFFCSRAIKHERILSVIKRKFREFRVLVEDKESLVLQVEKNKISFFYHAYPFLDQIDELDGVAISGILDIAAMKLIAISQRGLRRDFIDLYYVLQITPFFKIAECAHRRYGPGRINPIVIGKALVYFSDAENEPDPVYSEKKKVCWQDVKVFFQKHLKQFVLDLGAVM